MIERIEITDGTKLISHRAREVSPVTFLIWVSTESAKYFKDCFCDFVIPLCHIGHCKINALREFVDKTFTGPLKDQKRIWSTRLLRKDTTLNNLLDPIYFAQLVSESRNLDFWGDWCVDCEPEPGGVLTSAIMNKPLNPENAIILMKSMMSNRLYDFAMPVGTTEDSPYSMVSVLSCTEAITQNSYGWKWKTRIDEYASIPGLMVKAALKEYSLEFGLNRMPGYEKYMIYPSTDQEKDNAKFAEKLNNIAAQILTLKKKYDWV